jgi:hypothetical protein
MPVDPMKMYFTYDEVAERWCTCKRTVKRRVDAGLLKASYMLRNRPRISIAEIERFERSVVRRPDAARSYAA